MGSPFASKTRKNPIHGMSMALHSSFSSTEIPPATSLREKATKVGHLKKLSGKGILTSGTWRDRFCLLVKTKLYFYENEKSEGTEKSSGFVNLEYFDTCTEATTRMARKTTNVFVIGSTEKGFFESHSGRHYFAAETVTEMKEWVNAINTAMNQIRGKEKRTRDGSLTPAPGLQKKDSLNSKSQSKKEEEGGSVLPQASNRLDHVTKGRVKGPQGRRLPRKSHLGRASGISDSRPDNVDSLVDSDEEVRDSRGRATSLSALEASSITHPNNKSMSRLGSLSGTESGDRIDFDLSDGCSSDPSSSSSPVNNNPDLITNHDENFEQAWFIRMPTPTLNLNGSRAKGLDSEDVESTSDYSSMHGSPPSPKSGGKRSASKTPSNSTNSNTSFKSKFQNTGHNTEEKVGRSKENYDTWSNASADSDMIDSQDMDLVYKYSSEEDEDDSDEENRVPSNRNGRGSLTRSQNRTGGSTYIQKRGSGKGSSMYGGSTPLRNSSVTPPPCVLRKFRREQNGSIVANNIANPNKSKHSTNMNIGRDISPSPILLLDGDNTSAKPQRTSSGSSLSTLTADTYVSNNMTLMGSHGRQHSFSSLQRKKCGGSACSTSRAVSSANASPLLGNGGCHLGFQQTGQGRTGSSSGAGSNNRGSTSPYGTQSPNGTFDRNGSAAKAFHLERTMHNVSKELEAVSQETKQLESDVDGVKEDVGNVQDNLASVKGFVDATKDKVTKLQSQVGSIEKQVASIVKEAQTMREQAKKLLEIAENSKVTHENLMDEAEHLVTFLRQSTSCMSAPYHLQHGHTRAPYMNSCCSGNGNSTSGSQYYGITNGSGGHHGPVQPPPPPISSLRRNKGKTPERALDSDPEMELLDETQTQMENIIAKHRKSKALLSGSSSSGSAGSNNNHSHGLQSNRNSIIELGEGISTRGMNSNRSPKGDPARS